MGLFSPAPRGTDGASLRLHVGCGREAIPGWVNIDQYPLPGVDRVLDVGEGLPFENVQAVYAEHFLEHLSLHEGLAFLRGCRRALAPDGTLRLSTPNLDWVMRTHYRHGSWASEDEAMQDCVAMNRAFHGWGHQFLYNRAMLSAALRSAGFDRVTFHRYGESDSPELAGLERHETWQDEPELPHVLIAEASGERAPEGTALSLFEEYRQALVAR